jgi:hypothetical protein
VTISPEAISIYTIIKESKRTMQLRLAQMATPTTGDCCGKPIRDEVHFYPEISEEPGNNESFREIKCYSEDSIIRRDYR